MEELNWNIEGLTPNQKIIADFIEKNRGNVAYLTETDIAERLELSNATVSRFWKAIGYKNFKDFKNELKKNADVSPANKLENIINQVGSNDSRQQLMEICLQNLQGTMKHFSKDAFQQIIESMAEATTIHIYSPGPSEGLGQLLQFRLSRFGLSIVKLPKSGHELFEHLIHIKKEDIVFIFGFVQPHQETLVLLDHVKNTGAKSIVLTDRLVSDFNQLADYILYTDRGQLWEFHSMVAPTFLIESLIIEIGKFKKETALKKLDELNALRQKYKAEIPR